MRAACSTSITPATRVAPAFASPSRVHQRRLGSGSAPTLGDLDRDGDHLAEGILVHPALSEALAEAAE